LFKNRREISFIEAMYLKMSAFQDKINSLQVKLNEEQRKFNSQICEYLAGTFDGKADLDDVLEEAEEILNNEGLDVQE